MVLLFARKRNLPGELNRNRAMSQSLGQGLKKLQNMLEKMLKYHEDTLLTSHSVHFWFMFPSFLDLIHIFFFLLYIQNLQTQSVTKLISRLSFFLLPFWFSLSPLSFFPVLSFQKRNLISSFDLLLIVKNSEGG